MAELADRVYMRKRIRSPSDPNNYVDIPVIYQMRFKSMSEQAQERWLYFDNSSNSSRVTHIKRVINSTDEATWVDVERIDQWTYREMQSQAQDFVFVMVNNDPPPIQLTGSNSPAHQAVHYVRYYKDNDSESETFVDCELIDELRIKDSQAQEWIYYMKHPELGDAVSDPTVPYVVTKGFCDPTLPMAPEDRGT